MQRVARSSINLLTAAVLALGLLGGPPAPAAAAPAVADGPHDPPPPRPGAAAAQQSLRSLDATVSVNARSALAHFVSAAEGRPLTPPGLARGAPPEQAARAFLAAYGAAFGLTDAARELTVKRERQPGDGRTIVRFQQTHQGVPVFGGELIVQVDDKNNVRSLNGELSPDDALSTTPEIDAAAAADSARAAVAKWYGLDAATLTVSAPELWIYDPALVGPDSGPRRLVWRTEVPAAPDAPVRELVLVDAQRGNIAMHFNQIDAEWSRPQSGEPPTSTPTAEPSATETSAASGTPTETATAEPTATETQTPTSEPTRSLPVPAAGTGPWYVATTGSDTNDCLSTSTPCLTINGAIGKASAGDTIYVATGTYTGTGTEVVLINKSITLSGGWDAAFTTQNGNSEIDGESARRGITVNSNLTANLDRLTIQYGSSNYGAGLYISGTLTVVASSIVSNTAVYGGGGIEDFGALTIETTAVNNNQTLTQYSRGGGIEVKTGGVITATNSTISNNTVQGDNGAGGGVFTEGSSTATLNNTTVSDNQAKGGSFGGGIYAGGVLTVNNSIVSRNTAYGGGGIHAANPIILNNSTVSNNIATGSDGGGVTGNVTLNYSTISNNTAIASNSRGGGIFADSSKVVVLNSSTVTSNTASSGGGIYFYSGTLTISNSNIRDNSTAGIYYPYGGGVYINGGTVVVENSTLTGNMAATGGGGIYAGGGSLTLANVTVAGNTSSLGGGIYAVGAATVRTRNGIFSNNSAQNAFSGPNCYGNIASDGYNLIGAGSPCVFASTTGDVVGTLTLAINPLLGPLQDNGGATFTHALLPGSPAIDVGNPAAPGSGGNACFSTDQRGIARPQGTRCDIGAFESSFSVAGSPLLLTYTANNGTTLPGSFLCNETKPTCTNGSNPHADGAHWFARLTYNFYSFYFDRDSLDNAGLTITSTVHYSSSYANAYWDGTQVVYGDAYGWPLADDVVGHELTHGVTQYESGLFYYYQSGAINESLSDVFGEFVDQADGQGTDTPAVKWLMGEDVSGLSAFRSMSNPPAYADPDKMTSANYYTGSCGDALDITCDNGGVHTNSGVNNKAAYLLTDGGVFNGYTVAGLGLDKVARLYYEAQTNLLTSGADYADLYDVLYQACLNLVGTNGITILDCYQVRKATDAVEMNQQPVANYNTNPALCPTGQVPTNLFFDDMESGMGNWVTGTTVGTGHWYDGSAAGPYAHSGLHFLYGDDLPEERSDTYVTTTSSVVLPANAFLYFDHAYGFEYSAATNWDGGVLEYSIDDGSTWSDAGSLITANGYNGSIYTSPDTSSNNPLNGRPAFVNDSHGYIATKASLASLSGQNVRFRWRLGTDLYGFDWGWWLDDVRIYTCGAPPPPPANCYLLTTVITPTAAGAVTAGPAPNCGSGQGFSDGTTLYLGATPASNYYRFTGWTGDVITTTNPISLTVTSALSVTATFEKSLFADVPFDHPQWAEIQALWNGGYTSGCSTNPLQYCPATILDRAQGAVFVMRGQFGTSYVPPAPTSFFTDNWALGPYAEKWAEALFNNGFSSGCTVTPRMYCPWFQHTRAEASVFYLRILHGASYVPPAASGTLLGDVTDPLIWYAKWSEQAYLDGLLPACGTVGGKPAFCPNDYLSRAWAAYMMVKAKNLTLPQ